MTPARATWLLAFLIALLQAWVWDQPNETQAAVDVAADREEAIATAAKGVK